MAMKNGTPLPDDYLQPPERPLMPVMPSYDQFIALAGFETPVSTSTN